MPHASALRATVLHGLRLKGSAEVDALAAALGRDPVEVRSCLEALGREGLVVHRTGRLPGWTLTAPGRAANERAMAEELDDLGLRPPVRDAYDRFLGLNGELLAACTRWQVRTVHGERRLNDHTDPAYDRAVIGQLSSIDDRVQPICVELAARLERFGGYAERLRTARQRVEAGDGDWFTKPLIDSYHTVWFELHEDLLVSLGLERAAEVATR